MGLPLDLSPVCQLSSACHRVKSERCRYRQERLCIPYAHKTEPLNVRNEVVICLNTFCNLPSCVLFGEGRSYEAETTPVPS